MGGAGEYTLWAKRVPPLWGNIDPGEEERELLAIFPWKARGPLSGLRAQGSALWLRVCLFGCDSLPAVSLPRCHISWAPGPEPARELQAPSSLSLSPWLSFLPPWPKQDEGLKNDTDWMHIWWGRLLDKPSPIPCPEWNWQLHPPGWGPNHRLIKRGPFPLLPTHTLAACPALPAEIRGRPCASQPSSLLCPPPSTRFLWHGKPPLI